MHHQRPVVDTKNKENEEKKGKENRTVDKTGPSVKNPPGLTYPDGFLRNHRALIQRGEEQDQNMPYEEIFKRCAYTSVLFRHGQPKILHIRFDWSLQGCRSRKPYSGSSPTETARRRPRIQCQSWRSRSSRSWRILLFPCSAE